ncbi:MAG: adenosylcobinamide-phosphate synthase CbiB [Burkholderiales bacterium]
MHAALVTIPAVLLDRLLGEPRRAHPLVGFGRLAQTMEKRMNRTASRPVMQRLMGVAATMALLLPFATLSAMAAQLPKLGTAFEVVLLYLTLGGRSLTEHARRVVDALRANNLSLARTNVGYLVSRDTQSMQSDDVARAAVESVLENGNDACFGALFWFVVAGAPGAVFYRLANTLDAMWGYRTPRYLHFGWSAARLDDALNFIPARLTALTYALLGRFARAGRCWREQARAWDSPNAGPVMAAGAGALGVRLGGPASYHGAIKQRPPLGEGQAPEARDIERALVLVNRGTWLWLAAIAAGAWWLV